MRRATFICTVKQVSSLLFAAHFFLGGILLPQGNFDTITQLPEMYRHCRATEDRDMDLLDFITDHLLDIDSHFDPHGEGDDQKSHQPCHFQLHPDFNLFPPRMAVLPAGPTIPIYTSGGSIPWENDLLIQSYFPSFFHPPAIARASVEPRDTLFRQFAG